MELQTILRNRRKLLALLGIEPLQDLEVVPQFQSTRTIKKKGIYYTPKEITFYICFQALTSYISHILKNEVTDICEYIENSPPEELQRLFQGINNIKILDPACGTGIFLVQIAEMLFQFKKLLLKKLKQKGNEFELKNYIISNNIFGVDFFEDAVEQTKANLLQWLNAEYNSCDWEKVSSLLDWNIRVGNSLIGWLNEDIESIQVSDIFIHSIIKKLKEISKINSSLLNKEIQNIINLIQSNDFNKLLLAFSGIQNFFKAEEKLSSSILTKILQSLYNQLHNCINISFIKSLINEGFSEKNDALFIQKIKSLKPFHWNLDFHAIINDGGFDLIIGNPPYIFIRGENFSPFEISVYKKKFLRNYQSLAKGKARQSQKINSFSLFIVRGISLLKPEHFLGFIVPNTILRTTTNDFIRQFILENIFIQEIVDLEGSIFKGVTAATLLIFLQKKPVSMNPTLINFNIKNLLDFHFESHFINQIDFYRNPVFAFSIHLDSEFADLFNLMKKDTIELGEFTKEIIEGIVCRKSDNLFTSDSSHRLAKKLLRGKDIDRYQINWRPHQYIIYAIDTTLTKTKLHRPRPQWVHEAPEKLITQRIGGGIYPLRVAYDNSQYYTFASINNILLKNPLIVEKNTYLTKYILAILNSKLLNAYYLLNFSNKSALTVNISKTYLESLPIKKASIPIQNLICNLVDYLLFLYQFAIKIDHGKMQLCEFFDSNLLDSLIYEIYLQEAVGADLYKLVSDYILPMPNTLPDSAKNTFLFEIYQNLQNNPLINQRIIEIKTTPAIQKIEDLLQSRNKIDRKNSI